MSAPASATPYTWDHVPRLHELMTKTAGIPGVEYLQCAVANIRQAQDGGWLRTAGSEQRVFTIIGPDGSIDCELYSRGEPIPGQGPYSGARKCEIDRLIYEVTGLLSGYEDEEKAEKATAKSGSSEAAKQPSSNQPKVAR